MSRSLVDAVQVFRALGHPARLQMTEALGHGACCVTELKDLVGLSWSTVSRHLAQQHTAGIVRAEKRGNQVVYSLALPCVTALTQCLQAAAKGRRVEVRTCCG